MTAFKHQTRAPAAAPFPLGTRVRYVGDRVQYADDEGHAKLIGPGMEFVITEFTVGRQGTGAAYDIDDDGEPLVDQTVDGASIYLNARGERRGILARSAHEWEVVQ